MPRFTRNFWRELGIIFFSAECQEGETFGIMSPFPEPTLETPTVPVVLSGKFRITNPMRDPLEWELTTGKAEGGIVIPDQYTFEALSRDSVYACVSYLPPTLTEVTPDMFKLDHSYVESGSRSYVAADGYKAVIVMSGAVRFEGTAVTPGAKIDVPPTGAVELTVDSPAHLVGYRLVSV